MLLWLWCSVSELNKFIFEIYCQKMFVTELGHIAWIWAMGNNRLLHQLTSTSWWSYTEYKRVQVNISSLIILEFNRTLNMQWLIWQQNLIMTWTHLVAKPVLNWFEATYTLFSLVWISTIFAEKYWCLWLCVATPDRYIPFQNSKNFKKNLIQSISCPMGFVKGIVRFLLVVVLALKKLVVYWGVWQEMVPSNRQLTNSTESLPVGRYTHTYICSYKLIMYILYLYLMYIYVYLYIIYKFYI